MLFVCVRKCFVLSNHFPFINTLKEKIMSSHKTYFVRLTWKLGCPALGNWENARKTWFFHSEWTIPSIWINNASERENTSGKICRKKLDWVMVTEIFPLFSFFFYKEAKPGNCPSWDCLFKCMTGPYITKSLSFVSDS